MHPTNVEWRTFLICTQRNNEDDSCHGEWRAWCFFAYDRDVNIYPADSVPDGCVVQETIAGAGGASEDEARQAVEDILRRVIQTRNLEGTGFYSPPGDFTYPQGRFPPDKFGESNQA